MADFDDSAARFEGEPEYHALTTVSRHDQQLTRNSKRTVMNAATDLPPLVEIAMNLPAAAPQMAATDRKRTTSSPPRSHLLTLIDLLLQMTLA